LLERGLRHEDLRRDPPPESFFDCRLAWKEREHPLPSNKMTTVGLFQYLDPRARMALVEHSLEMANELKASTGRSTLPHRVSSSIRSNT